MHQRMHKAISRVCMCVARPLPSCRERLSIGRSWICETSTLLSHTHTNTCTLLCILSLLVFLLKHELLHFSESALAITQKRILLALYTHENAIERTLGSTRGSLMPRKDFASRLSGFDYEDL